MPNIPKSIIEKIQKNDPNVQHLDLSNYGLNDNDISELQELLQNNLYIDSLNLAYNNITSKGCELLKLLPKLRKIDLSHCAIGDKGVSALISTKINDLDISYCGITENGAKLLEENLNKYVSLGLAGNPTISADTLKNIRSKFVKDPYVSSSPIGIDLGMNLHSFSASYFYSDVVKENLTHTQQHDETLAAYEQLNEFVLLLEKTKEMAKLLNNQNILSHLGESPLKTQTSKVVSSIINLEEPLEEIERTLSSIQNKPLTPKQ